MVKLPPEKLGSFYLGAKYDLHKSELTDEAINYDARDLTTHAVCVGMTGSGKTGLCVGLLEEAALDKVPALIIDPKGDMTNLLLQFENLSPDDFKPWVNPDDASRKNMTIDEYAEKISSTWTKGIAGWGQSKERIKDLKSSVKYNIYTPGSTAGIPINILGSFAAPKINFDDDAEMLRERILGIVAALLGMVNCKEDPVRSKEGLLLANLFEHYWRAGEDLDLSKLINGIQNPPMSQLGVFNVETFYPSKERFELAMSFNSLIASPQFKNWLIGTPLDIDKLYFDADGKPKHSIFYIAHLSDSERMFFVTILLNSLISWMRRQSGTTSLRSLLYFDEIFGYFPPTANPPSKKPLLTLLKQARAFGVGCVLVTQNPVDLGYKGLSNAGTWFIGKLQTDKDKERVMGGLEGAIGNTDGNSKKDFDRMISALDSRVFLMHNVHEDEPVVFHTRWVLSYLRGPMTRPQVQALMKDRKNELPNSGETKAEFDRHSNVEATSSSEQAPSIDPSIDQLFLKPTSFLESSKISYQPKVLTVTRIRYFDAKRKIDKIEEKAILIDAPDEFGRIAWNRSKKIDNWQNEISHKAISQEGYTSSFDSIPDTINSPKKFKQIQSDISDYLYHNSAQQMFQHEELEIFQRQGESKEAFLMRVSLAAKEERDEEIDELQEAYEKKLERIQDKIRREERDLYEAESESKSRKQDEMINIAETIFSVLGKRRRKSFSTVSTKRRMSRRATERVDSIRDEIEDLELDLKDLNKELDNKIDDIRQNWMDQETLVSKREIKPRRSDIMIDSVALCWCPETS